MGIRITGLGKALGSVVVTNHDIEQYMDTSDEWIRTRTGIRERRWCRPDESTATLATDAARMALKHASRDDVDLVVTSTTTPETQCPPTAAWVQGELGLHGGAFDLNAACSGWVYALVTVAGLVELGVVDSAVVVAAETFSRFINRDDRSTGMIFGDGAGAAVIERVEGRGDLLASELGNDGSVVHLISIPAGGARMPASIETVEKRLHALQMAGQETFRVATRVIAQTCGSTLAKAGLGVDDVDLFVPHQANARIINYACAKLGIPPERTMVNIDKYGNISSASVPLALCEAWEQGRMQPGDTVLLSGFGAGMSWATTVLDWSLPL